MFPALALLLTSCPLGLPKVAIDCSLSNSNAQSGNNKLAGVSAQPSDALKIEVLVDGTPSMQGFVKNSKQSRYEQTIDLIDQTAKAIKQSQDVTYSFFGTERKAGNYLAAKQPASYAGGAGLTNSQLNAAITPPDPNKLSIIVTDLYQTDTDINSVNEILKNDYLEKGYAVGVLGVRSQFKGKVYDIGRDRAERHYTTTDQEERFRPFYIIFLGLYANIASYFDQLKSKDQAVIREEQFVIFHSNSFSKPSMFDFAKYRAEFPKSKKSLKAIKTVSDGNVVGSLKQPNAIAALQVTSDPSTTETDRQVKHQVPYNGLAYTLAPKEFTTGKTQSERFDRTTQKFMPIEVQALQFKNWIVSDNASNQQLSFVTQIDPTALQPGVYVFKLDVSPVAFQEPEWWKRWNFDESEFDRVNQANFDGSRTINLQRFLQGLNTTTTQLVTANKPTAAHLCFAVQKN
jgi:hypothetical protein